MSFGIVILIAQVILESFPISSSGHVKLLYFFLLPHFFELKTIATSIEFEFFMQLPTVIVVVLFFYPKWYSFLQYPWRYRSVFFSCFVIAMISDIIAALFFILFYYTGIKQHISLGFGFCITAIVLWCDYFINQNDKINDQKEVSSIVKKNKILYGVFLGLAQGIALLPGVSRFAMTYVCAHYFLQNRRKAWITSWMILMPMSIVAGLLGFGIMIIKKDPIIITTLIEGANFFSSIGAILISMIISFVSMRLVQKQLYAGCFFLWGFYMLLPLVVWLLYCAV